MGVSHKLVFATFSQCPIVYCVWFPTLTWFNVPFAQHNEPCALPCRSQVNYWSLAKTVDNGFIGSLSANCTDGLVLPAVTYGYNGTANCSVSLVNQTAISNQGYKSLGNFSYRYLKTPELCKYPPLFSSPSSNFHMTRTGR